MLVQAPLWGHGLGAYGRLYPRERVAGALETKYAHNFILQIAVETGLAGLALFLWFVFLLLRPFLSLLFHNRSRATRLALGAAPLLFLLDSLGDYSFYVREFYLDAMFLSGAFLSTASGNIPVASIPARPLPPWMKRTPLFLSGFLFLAGLCIVIVPHQMAGYYSQKTDDIWSAIAARPPAEQQLAPFEALQLANRAVAWEPSNPYLLAKRGHANAHTGQRDAAAHDFSRACELQPASASIRAEWANYEWQWGKREHALRLMEQAVALYPLKSSHRIRLAAYLADMGRKNEALDMARAAVRISVLDDERNENLRFLERLTNAPGANPPVAPPRTKQER